MRWMRRVRRKRRSTVTKHYVLHREAARSLVHARLAHYNAHYGFVYNRVAIRNQRRCWGSCTSLKNLNFSYRLLFLPPELADYVIVHELCHLKELNHSPRFWALVAETIPEYQLCRRALRQYDYISATVSAKVSRGRYLFDAIVQAKQVSGAATISRLLRQSSASSEDGTNTVQGDPA